jgi:hypothetical protein
MDDELEVTGNDRRAPATSSSEPGVPVKLEKPVQAAVKHYSTLYDESQMKFISRLMAYFVEHNAAEISAKEEAWMKRRAEIDQGLPKLSEMLSSRVPDA